MPVAVKVIVGEGSRSGASPFVQGVKPRWVLGNFNALFTHRVRIAGDLAEFVPGQLGCLLVVGGFLVGGGVASERAEL